MAVSRRQFLSYAASVPFFGVNAMYRPARHPGRQPVLYLGKPPRFWVSELSNPNWQACSVARRAIAELGELVVDDVVQVARSAAQNGQHELLRVSIGSLLEIGHSADVTVGRILADEAPDDSCVTDMKTCILQLVPRFRYRDDIAFAWLINCLIDKAAAVRLAAAESLRWEIMGGATATSALVSALDDSDIGVVRVAATNLFQHGPVDPSLLRSVCHHPDQFVRTVASAFIVHCSREPGSDAPVDVLVRGLASSDEQTCEAACHGLAGIDAVPAAAIDQVLRLTGHSCSCVRAAAARLLGKWGRRQAVEPLIDLYSSEPHAYVRSAAVDALHQCGVSPPTATRIKWLRHDDPLVRADAYHETVKDRDQTVVLPFALEDLGHADPDVRAAAAFAAARIGTVAVPGLIERTFDTDPKVREAAAKALQRTRAGGRGAIPALRQLMQDGCPGVRKQAVLAILCIAPNDSSVLPVLVRMLREEPINDRYFAADELAGIGESGLAELLVAVKHPDVLIRAPAISALANARRDLPASIVPTVVQITEHLSHDPDWAVRYPADELRRCLSGNSDS